jgi:hypothetical protein
VDLSLSSSRSGIGTAKKQSKSTTKKGTKRSKKPASDNSSGVLSVDSDISSVRSSTGIASLEASLYSSEEQPAQQPAETPQEIKTREQRRAAVTRFRSLLSEEQIQKSLLQALTKKDGFLNSLKVSERTLKHAQLSRQIERKRRLLTEQQARRRGPPALEPLHNAHKVTHNLWRETTVRRLPG